MNEFDRFLRELREELWYEEGDEGLIETEYTIAIGTIGMFVMFFR